MPTQFVLSIYGKYAANVAHFEITIFKKRHENQRKYKNVEYVLQDANKVFHSSLMEYFILKKLTNVRIVCISGDWSQISQTFSASVGYFIENEYKIF